MLIIYIVLAFGWRSILFFLIFGDEQKIHDFFTAIFGPKLHVIISSNYWIKRNLDKVIRRPKDTGSSNKFTKFQVDSLIRSRDIVYTVLKNIFFWKTRFAWKFTIN